MKVDRDDESSEYRSGADLVDEVGSDKIVKIGREDVSGDYGSQDDDRNEADGGSIGGNDLEDDTDGGTAGSDRDVGDGTDSGNDDGDEASVSGHGDNADGSHRSSRQ